MSTSTSSSLYPTIDMKDVAGNKKNEAVSPPGSNSEAREEILIKIPGSIVHLIEKDRSVELACDDDIRWPLARDEAAVKLDESHYFFTLRVPENETDGAKEISPDELEKNKELMEKSSSAYWTVLAPKWIVEGGDGFFKKKIRKGLIINSNTTKPLPKQVDTSLILPSYDVIHNSQYAWRQQRLVFGKVQKARTQDSASVHVVIITKVVRAEGYVKLGITNSKTMLPRSRTMPGRINHGVVDERHDIRHYLEVEVHPKVSESEAINPQSNYSKCFDDDGRLKRTGNFWTSSSHIITAVIGSGVLSLAWAIAQLGWVAGPAVMVLFAFVNLYTSNLLAQCYRRTEVMLCGLIQYLNLFGVAIGYTIAASVSMMAIKRSNCFHSSGGKDPCHMSSNGFMITFGIIEILFSQIPDFDQEMEPSKEADWYQYRDGNTCWTSYLYTENYGEVCKLLEPLPLPTRSPLSSSKFRIQ
ncbi:hypothetical protein NC653_024017 [Populus alba x Populus x berolinensis]|uniref:Amino acid transporter transmembrane domain-containing protein n=1 Tax=Populus alba x Populus x berolinensis TaxID=444605 RepID=A0AAD6ML46_9ROSI|nr:hypothetical protein NC653_024017 [Populus alba x Populus x berolinensis]